MENGGEAPAKDVLAAGKSVGYSEKTLKNARSKVADTTRRGFGKDGVRTWILRIGPGIGPIGPTKQTPGSMGPIAGSMAPADASDGTDTTDTQLHYGDLRTACGDQELWSEVSVDRGICGRCWAVVSKQPPSQEEGTA